VPDSSITCGLDDTLSLIVTVPDFVPCVFGEKVTLMVQFAPTATLAPQVEVTPFNARISNSEHSQLLSHGRQTLQSLLVDLKHDSRVAIGNFAHLVLR
jgi:hypothetical protein